MNLFFFFQLSPLIFLFILLTTLPIFSGFNLFFYTLKTFVLGSFEFSFGFLSVALTVIFVSFCVFIFSFFYMKEEALFSYFILAVILFVLSMLILCLSNSIFFLFLGWDGLGITSFVLIMYYSNWKSMNNSMLTLLSNRIGDGLILLFIGLVVWDLFTVENPPFFITSGIVLIVFVGLTKSAQSPISAWLPAAMAAPTPVSALVHSSTLVTAGVVLILKFYFVLFSSKFQPFLFTIGILTIFIAGLSSLMEMDFKKLVALSTLSQMGMLFFILGLSSKWLTLFHLMSHAFFKSCLFLVVGAGLHFMFSQQDWRTYSFLSSFSLSQTMTMFICVICLCGLFFSSGFISKDLVLDFFSNKILNEMVLFIFLGGLLLTFVYSLRLFFSLFKKTLFNQKLLFLNLSFFSEVSPLLLLFFSVGFSLWFFLNFSFFFSSVVAEKKLFLCFIVILLISLCFLLFSSYFMKTMFFLDPLTKMSFFEQSKQSSFFEKSFIDFFYFYLVFSGAMKKSFLIFFSLSKTKKLSFLFLSGLVLFGVLLSLLFSLKKA